ncbi:sensor histidine kinase [Mycetocola zhujimingii]|uniref:Histidine kinase n=1 Tax=Mycetocola zhujimingii TaxID=2079792 RepID=A0A2U1TI55_9MICO|nr:histidine kinase [Mycetocola zhujimingii]PWC08473.1 histidine kinase [Mycetocola zhujimingii]
MSGSADAQRGALRLRRARVLALTWLASAVFSSVLMPGIGVLREGRPDWIAWGTLGIAVFAVAQAGALYGAVTPDRAGTTVRGWKIAFGFASVASLALVAPVAPGAWSTWSWIGASIVGTLPLILTPARALATGIVVLLSGAIVAAMFGNSVPQSIVIVGGIGIGLAAVNWSPVWLWRLIGDAQAGRAASASLAVTEERLRFARDVHDLLGHSLALIALKAELVSRVVAGNPQQAAAEASEIRRLAATALDEMRTAVSGSRQVDIVQELESLRDVLEASGIRCSLTTSAQVEPRLAAVLAPVAREAVTNVLRHSRASWCTISLSRDEDSVVLTVTNNGIVGGGDSASGGLQGARERLREIDGDLQIADDGREFVLRAAIAVPA